ncbi:hypothetical protein AGABI1DRAFT_114486 [Agaricus bisporus var. burnettii JB137-S8]|uniref:Uncharacterized protein n=1 Tax=Agaricus bisporus var. burnettii (strain JB137-S8 / ATCC MYA-4627 / FGSC 10392) TaxID=597362 RepID=K5X7J3_AGABU|nr:uncharacterized protein AGABI1DRAFT_114486 [Agaricus bisporus var. burnettii JB137-S8]EKM78957.1 hypothetical protein AGABI1DRAFT_114486 [Agaricus bisporus var. burnettii JB137-S8]
MAVTRTQTTQPGQGTQLCDLCHLKPKFGGHQYCSKTCASKAATFCNHCHKKPKFQNFDYCGKHCASLATANGAKPKAGGPATNNATKKNGATNANQQLAGVSGTTIDPMQIAQLVVQHVPQIQSMIAAAQNPGSTTSGASMSAQPNGSSITSNGTDQTTSSATKPNGILPVPSFLRGKKKTQTKLTISTKPTTDDLRCIIPGCKQSVYVDEEGVTSDFCSLRHREEAVTSGLLSPCIMCLVLPQSDTDYFCSMACRDEAMTKHYDEDETVWSPAESAN